MNSDEVNALRGIIEQRSEVKAGDEFDVGTTSIIAVSEHNSGHCALNEQTRCVFSGTSKCPNIKIKTHVVAACVPHVGKAIVFVPKLEYLTWKLTRS